MPNVRLQILVTLGVMGTTFFLGACQTGTSGNPDATNPTPADSISAPPSDPSTTVRVAMTHAPASLDPALVSISDSSGQDLVENLYIGLTRFDASTNDVVPALATDWTVSSDGLRWTFTLREDVSWVAVDPQSGSLNVLRPVTSSDVIYAVWRACHPATDAPHAAELFVIVGCREVNHTDPTLVTEDLLTSTIRVTGITPDRFTVELAEEAGYFLSLTTTPLMRPQAREAFAPEGAEWRDMGLLASSGAWAVAEYAPGERIRLLTNPEWPLERGGNVDALDIQFAADSESARLAFQASEVDAAVLSGGSPDVASLTRTRPRVTFLVFALDQFPTNIEGVRRGLAAAIDRERLVNETLGGEGVALSGLAPPGSVAAPNHANEPASSFDPEFARQQMAAADFPNCQLFPQVTFRVDWSARSLSVARALAGMWQDNLICNNTRFEIEEADMRLLLEDINTPLAADWQTRPELTLVTWQGDYPDAANWLGDVLHCEWGYLQTGRECDVVDELIERAATERGTDARAALYAEIEALFFNSDGSQPVAPLFTDAERVVSQAWLNLGIDQNVVYGGPLRFDTWQVDESAGG